MSRSSRQRDSLTPSLFPFLAVLLCTMGALVLILMLVVSGAQASALQIAEKSVHRAEEVESQLKLAGHGFQKQLTEAQIELEKKRLGLQHLENHIQELLAELEQLQRTVELADADGKSDEDNEHAQAEAISELEKQLLEAHDKLKQKLDKPEGDKPIFAIVPYDGPNGTHRRPIYLECIEQGIRIQPEGVLIHVADLEPPYGPGNPLDAALRTIRAQYAPANHAVTSTAYPLLVVRPSGIRSYAMARAAMSGWDDQFGYELVGEDVDLAFPEGDPGLATKITQALNLARERQAALIVAMPQKYRAQSERDRPLTGGSSGPGGSGNAAYGAGGYGSGSYGSGDYSPEQDGSGGYAGNTASGAGSGAGAASAGKRGGWATDSSDGLSSSGSGDGLRPQSTGDARTTSADSLLGFGGPAADSTTGSSGKAGAGDSFFGTASAPNNSASGSYGPGGSYGSAGESSRRDAGGMMSAGGSGESSSDALGAPGGGGSSGGRQADSGNSSAANSSKGNASASGASGGAAGGSSGGSQMSGQPASGSQMAMPFKTPGQSDSGSQSSSGGDSAAGSTSSAGNASGSAQGGSAGSSSQASADASGQQGMPQLSLDKTFNGQKQESAAPVASRRGRGWAWSQGPRTQTPVGRSIRMQCLADRWIVLPDSGKANDPAAITITFDTSPQQRAEKLAKVVAERVDSWGLALTGGYWKPTLLVDVGPDAEWRFNQLQQLLDASGLEIQRGK